MWDNPRLLNAVAGALTALALLVFAVAALLALLRSPLFPLRELTVRGPLGHTTRAEVAQATQGRVTGNFFAVDLGAVRAALEGLPWVRRVQVQRIWPDRLEVSFEEHVVLARWGEAGLVNQQGERFAGRGAPEGLPLFAGPQGSEGEVTRRYRHFSEILAPLGAGPQRLVLTPRYAWQLQLADGLAIELGRDAPNDAVERRLARFAAVYGQTLAKMQRKPAPAGTPSMHVDLRYPNGFALRVADLKGG